MPEKFESEIIETKNISPSVRHLKISVPENFKFIPGQYVSFIIETDGKKLRRPYSICSKTSDKNHIGLCIKIVKEGLVTNLIKNLKPKDKLTVLGPLGEFVIDEKSKTKNIIFISTGSGIGPFRSMIPFLLESEFKKSITLITGYKNNEEILYDNEFKELENKYNDFAYKTITSDKGHVQDIMENTEFKNTDVYLCGLTAMISSVRSLLVKKGVEMKNIFSEKYD